MRVRGFVLVPVLAFILVLALLAYGASRRGPAAVAQVARAEDAADARYAAEAGLAHAIWQAGQSNCARYDDLAAKSFGGATYVANYSAPNGSPVTVTATGSAADGASHTLERTIDVYQLPVGIVNQPDGSNADTFIEQGGSSGKGNQDTLRISGKRGDEKRALLQVDLSTLPSGARVVSATLEGYAKKANASAGAELAAYRLTQAWSEANATWSNHDVLLLLGQPWKTPGGDYEAEPVGRTDIANGTPSTQLDLTAVVQAWLDGDFPNYGVLLAGNPSLDDLELYSSDRSTPSQRPRLLVEYVCLCGSICAPVMSNGTTLILSMLEDSTLTGVSFENGDLLRHAPAAGTSAIVIREDESFDADENIDAVHAWDDGRFLLSTDTVATLAGLTFEDEDLVEYDPGTGTATLVFDGSARFAADEDVDAVHAYSDGRLVISTDSTATIAGVSVEDEDLVEYDPTTGVAALIFDGSSHFAADEEVDGVQVLDDGRFLLSTDSGARLGGLDFLDSDVVLYDPLEDTAVTAFDGAGVTSATDPDVDALHDFRPYPLTNELRLEPVADTQIASTSPNANFGGTPLLRVGNALRSLLRFDLSALPVGATVTSAVLYLNLDSNGAGLLTGAYQITADWAEGTATWANTGGGGTFAVLPVATATFSSTAAIWTKWVLPPALIHEWRDGVSPNYGLLLKPTLVAVGTSISRSRNHPSAAVHPRLVIKYTLP
jgi:hypothetical protein